MSDKIPVLGQQQDDDPDEIMPMISFDNKGDVIRSWSGKTQLSLPVQQRLRCPFKAERCNQNCVAIDVVEGMHQITGKRIDMVICGRMGIKLGRIPGKPN